MSKSLMVGLAVAAGLVVVGGGVLLLRNTSSKSLPAGRQDQIPSSLEMPVPGSNVEEKVVTSGKVVEVTVEGSNFKFSPTTITALRGDTVKLTFKSMGGIHNLVIDQFGVETSQLGEGEEEEVEFVVDKMGTFEYYCAVDGHQGLGMTGKLTVE